MTTYYTTAEKVAALMQIEDFTTDSKPTTAQVEDLINRAEDEIDFRTHNSWRTTRVTDEYYNFNRSVDPYGMYVGMKMYQRIEGFVPLTKRKIHTFSSGTHKIEVWDGGQFVDCVSDASKTEGQDKDYWLDYEQGFLYFVSDYPKRNIDAVRMTYDYGDSTIPKDIEQACTMMVAINIALLDDRSFLLPEGSSNIYLPNKVTEWKGMINKILDRRTELVTVSIL